MTRSTNSLFQSVFNWAQGPLLIVTCFFSFMAVIIGINLFIEDTSTSYYGLQKIEELYGVRASIYPITYLSMSITPQIGQILFYYIFLSDMKKNRWALFVALGMFAVDFVADVYWRSHGNITLSANTGAASSLTFFFFTIGAELFISVGFGIFFSTLGPAIKETKNIWKDISFTSSAPQPRRQARRTPQAREINPADLQ